MLWSGNGLQFSNKPSQSVNQSRNWKFEPRAVKNPPWIASIKILRWWNIVGPKAQDPIFNILRSGQERSMVARLEPPTSVIVLNEISSSFKFDHALRTWRNCAISQYSVLGRLRPYEPSYYRLWPSINHSTLSSSVKLEARFRNPLCVIPLQLMIRTERLERQGKDEIKCWRPLSPAIRKIVLNQLCWQSTLRIV